MKDFIDTIATRKLRTATNGVDIHQTDRNDLRKDALDALQVTLAEGGLTVHRTDEGIAITAPNDEFGTVVLVTGLTVKDANYDAEYEATEYEAKLVAKAEKEKEKAIAKAKKATPKKATK